VVLTKVSAPWAYSKGEPFRTIAALELLGALFAFMLFKDGAEWLQGSSFLSLTGFTDNQGNTFVLDRLMTSKYPLVVIPSCSSFMCLTGFTDNQRNTFVLDRLMTSKFPLAVILIRLAEQLAASNIGLSLRWVPRRQNEEADALTNGCFEGVAPELRVEARIEDGKFVVLTKLMSLVVR
jgi:hypothetical protein